jgi:hypothetical protein
MSVEKPTMAQLEAIVADLGMDISPARLATFH